MSSPTYGVTAQGFLAKTVQVLLSDIEAQEIANIDPAIDTSPEMPLGQLNGIYANKLAELWELAAVAYNGYSRQNAEGPQLDNVNNLTGTKRNTASPSTTNQTCVFSLVGTYNQGALVANVNGQSSVQFANGNNISVTGTGPYTATNTDTGVVLATNATLPITVPNMTFICTVNGPTVANAGTLTVITNPVNGWQSTTNPTDATLGTNVETDTAYRIRGEQEIAAAGSGNPDAIVADVQNVPGVIQAFCIENTSNYVDSYSNSPHSFTVVIWDGASPQANDSAVAQAIWNDKPAGIQANGSITDGIATDVIGGTHVVPFNRANQKLLYLTYTVTMMPGQPAINSTNVVAMKTAIVAATQTRVFTSGALNPAFLGLGGTVYAEAMKSALLQAGFDIANVSALQLGFSASPSGTTDLSVDLMSIALADTSRITINGF